MSLRRRDAACYSQPLFSMKKRSEITQSLYAQFFEYKPRKGDLRKIAILETTIHLLAHEGLEATSFESIGKKLGIGRAHVSYYYPSRLDLIESAFKFAIGTGQTFSIEALKACPEGGNALEAFVNGTFEWFHTFPEHARVFLLLYYMASVDKRLRKLHDEIRATGAERIAAVLSAGTWALPKKEIPQLAKLVQTILTGHLLDFYSTHPSWDLEELRKRTQKEIARLLKSYT